jgi:actin-related protein
VQDLLVNSIARCDLDLRRGLYTQIVLAGGSTCYPGYGERLLHEIRTHSLLRPGSGIAGPGSGMKVRIAAPPERQVSTWIGGSILASLSTFQSMWVNKKDYLEHGAKMLHAKML